MAIRSDISINWEVSPRQITINSPSIECTMQDLLDTLRYRESLSKNIDDQSIVVGSGKVVLDAEGNAVGLTVQLINATIGFETRSGPTWIECGLSGGNLSGLEADESTVTTVVTHNNPYVNINKTSSVSATISESTISDNLDYAGVLHYDEGSIYSGQSHPIGTASSPVNNISDGIAICLKYNLPEIHSLSNINIDRDVTKFSVKGIIPNLTFYSNGFKAHLCKFNEIKIDGDFNNSLIKANGCHITRALNVYGAIDNSYHTGEILIAANQNLNMDVCQSGIAGLDSPVVNMNPGEDTTFSSRAFSGGQTIKHCDTPNCVATLSFSDGGKPHLEPSNTDGLLSVRGLGYLDDRSNGSIIDTTAFFNPIQVQELYKLQGLDVDNPMTVTPTQRSVDNINLDISGDGENVTVVTRQ